MASILPRCFWISALSLRVVQVARQQRERQPNCAVSGPRMLIMPLASVKSVR